MWWLWVRVTFSGFTGSQAVHVESMMAFVQGRFLLKQIVWAEASEAPHTENMSHQWFVWNVVLQPFIYEKKWLKFTSLPLWNKHKLRWPALGERKLNIYCMPDTVPSIIELYTEWCIIEILFCLPSDYYIYSYSEFTDETKPQSRSYWYQRSVFLSGNDSDLEPDLIFWTSGHFYYRSIMKSSEVLGSCQFSLWICMH